MIFGEIYVEGKLLTPVDPYLHEDIIKKSNTFNKLINENPNEEDVVKLIKEQDLLNEKIKIKGPANILKNLNVFSSVKVEGALNYQNKSPTHIYIQGKSKNEYLNSL